MNKTYLLMLATISLLSPFALAIHGPAGIGFPKNYCEPQSEWNTHEYWVGATGFTIFGLTDGNLAGDCDNSGLDLNGTVPCGHVNPEDPFQSGGGLCESALPVADYDGHSEFAFGGAWLLVDSGDGSSSGSLACYGEPGHHPTYGPISVLDAVLGFGATFTVAADTVDLTGGATGPCGDLESDESSDCIGPCTVTFPPGIDGAYYVFVTGSAGNVFS